MCKRKQAVMLLRILLLFPFFAFALIPQGIMLVPGQGSFSKMFIICPGFSVGSASAKHHEMMGHAVPSEDTQQVTVCPYSIANAAYIDTTGILSIPNSIAEALTELPYYYLQHRPYFYPSKFPRGPPVFV